MFRFIKQALALVCFGGLPATNCVSMNNQSCITRAALTDLNSDEVHYYPFMVSLDTCDASCTTIKDPSGRICVPNKRKT